MDETKESYQALYNLKKRMETHQKYFEQTQKELQKALDGKIAETLRLLPEGHDPKAALVFAPGVVGFIFDGKFCYAEFEQ